MSFTEAEKRKWYAERRSGRDVRETESVQMSEVCGHCGQPFPRGNGVVTEDFSICDVCND